MTPHRTIAVTGSSGLIGSALVRSLQRDGYDVRRLVRRPPAARGEVAWDPAAGTIDAAGLEGVDGVVHLAGAGVGNRLWTTSYRREILESRTRSTALLAGACAALPSPPRSFVCGSATGFYGETGQAPVDESSPAGSGFLADVVQAWEAAAAPAQAAGIRVAFARTGVVTTATGGALGRLLPLIRLGAGGRLGSGEQWWGLISLDDEVRALRLLLDDDRASGPYNLVEGSYQLRDLVKALGRAYGRPTVLPVPGPVLRLVLGELSSVLLANQRIATTRLPELGFVPGDRGMDGLVAAVRAGR